MTTNNNRGGKREGAGRRPSTVTFRREEYLIVERHTLSADNPFHKPELARVLSASADELEVQIGDDIVVLRRPEPGELEVRDTTP